MRSTVPIATITRAKAITVTVRLKPLIVAGSMSSTPAAVSCALANSDSNITAKVIFAVMQIIGILSSVVDVTGQVANPIMCICWHMGVREASLEYIISVKEA